MTSLPRVLYYLALANRRLSWDKERLKRFQDKRIRRLVRHAYGSVPFYNRVLKEAGLDPYSVKGVDDLSKLPIIKKDVFKRQSHTLLQPRRVLRSWFQKSMTLRG